MVLITSYAHNSAVIRESLLMVEGSAVLFKYIKFRSMLHPICRLYVINKEDV